MYLHDINYLINLQDITITNFSISENQSLFLTATPLDIHQACPCCQTNRHVISIGTRQNYRTVRHLDCFQYETYLMLPMQRLWCKACDFYFTYQYAFIDQRSRYTIAFQQKVAHSLSGSTVQQVAKLFNLPYSTCERIVKKHLNEQVPKLQKTVIQTAEECNHLVLGMDDFAIRKGHSYNTGIHDLKHETLLMIIKGRTYTDLIENKDLMIYLTRLNPKAVVMDLSRSYHKFCAKVFPNALRIADRFHVNRYITEALQAVRRRISQTLAPDSVKYLKRHKNLLNQRWDELKEKDQTKLRKLLSFSNELADVYQIKEQLIDWYELSDSSNSYRRLNKWIEKGESLNIPELNEGLKPFKNWTQEISNYHHCRYTNAAVEGRNNKIKTLQRRCYFLRNRTIYENRIYQECNYKNCKSGFVTYHC